MEVNNQMMDQLLVNTAAQTPASPNAQRAKDTDGPNFDSMVNQRRATDRPSAGNAKIANGAKPEKAEKTNADAEAEQGTVQITDEQYAIAAAMMMQTMPDGPRAAQVQPELIAAEDTVTVEAVLFDGGEITVETPTQEAAPETAVAVDAQAQPETQQTAVAQTEPEASTERPVETAPEAHAERPMEAKPQQETPRAEQTSGETKSRPQQTVREETTRTENAPEQLRFVRSETKPRTEDDAITDDTRSAQAAPLFRNVEAPVVKVAEASRPIPLEAEDGVEHLTAELDDIVVNHVDVNRVEVTLTPENLGKLTVEITRGENGNLSIVLHTTTERAANLLERNTAHLQSALTANRHGDVEVQVRPSEESERQFLNPDGRNDQNRQQQQQHSRRQDKASAQDFLQQLRLGLVDNDNDQ